MVVGGRMRGRSSAVVCRRRAGSAAPTSPVLRRRRRQPHALGSSAGVRGHGAAGRAGGTAPAARPQTSPFHIGMGKAAKASSNHGGAYPGDCGARRARAVRRRGRAARAAAQHTAARRRVRARRSFTVTSPLSASRADNEQLPASAEQVRERRARVGGRGGGRSARRAGRGWGRGRRGGSGGQEGRAAAEGDAVVGAHGRAPAAAAAAALRHGAAPRAAARRVTEPRAPHHAYIPLSGR